MAQAKNINSADLTELAHAFQVSTERAQAILKKREELGGFKSWEEIKRVPGISEGIVENLQGAGFGLGGSSSTSSEEQVSQQEEQEEQEEEEEEEEEEE